MKIILIILFSSVLVTCFSQESKEIELRYVTRTTTYTDGHSSSTGKMQWKLKEETGWKDLGRQFSSIETVLSTNEESMRYLNIAKSYRTKYKVAIPLTIIASMSALFIVPSMIDKNADPNKDESMLGMGAKLLPFLGCALGGSYVIGNFKDKGYDNLKYACGAYNSGVNPRTTYIQTMQFGLSFGNTPSVRSYPQLTFRIGLN